MIESCNAWGGLLFFFGSAGGFRTYILTAKTNYDLLVYSKMTLRKVTLSLGRSVILSERQGNGTIDIQNLSRKELLQSHSKQTDIGASHHLDSAITRLASHAPKRSPS